MGLEPELGGASPGLDPRSLDLARHVGSGRRAVLLSGRGFAAAQESFAPGGTPARDKPGTVHISDAFGLVAGLGPCERPGPMRGLAESFGHRNFSSGIEGQDAPGARPWRG